MFNDLRAALAASPELFVKPRTQIFHGIKVGFVKGKGKPVAPSPKEVKTETKAEDVKDESQLLGNHEKKEAENK